MGDTLTAGAKRARAEAKAIRATADTLQREAARLECEAERRDLYAEHLETIARIPEALEKVRRWIAAGCTTREALDHVAFAFEVYGMRRDSLEYHWQLAQRKTRTAAKWKKDREVMRLAALGRTNVEIGAEVGLHPKSVSRIVRAQLRGSYADNRRREIERLDHACPRPDHDPRPLRLDTPRRLRGPGASDRTENDPGG